MQSKWIVLPEEEDIRVPLFLEKRASQPFSRKKWKRLLEKNCLRVNGKVERFSSRKLRVKDVVELDLSESLEKKTVLYEDAFLQFLNKPSQVTCSEENFSHPLVHRLDKETTGVLALAKDPETLLDVQNQFRNREVEKTYLAIVDGLVQKKSGKIVSRISKKKEGYFVSSEKGAYAETNWKLLHAGKKASLLELTPKTGKSHQIRLHLQDIGHPILGDYHYVRSFRSKFFAKRVLLHAAKLRLVHPKTGRKIEVQAKLPEDFLEAIQKIFDLPLEKSSLFF